jgi:hypothetical protein
MFFIFLFFFDSFLPFLEEISKSTNKTLKINQLYDIAPKEKKHIILQLPSHTFSSAALNYSLGE